jgi:hydrogenase maturation protein HypF
VADDAQSGVSKQRIARRFHSTLATVVCRVCNQIRQDTRLKTVALSGGVFMNALLTELALEQLTAAGFEVLRHHLVPPNDGGICLGQLAIAAQSLSSGSFQPSS